MARKRRVLGVGRNEEPPESIYDGTSVRPGHLKLECIFRPDQGDCDCWYLLSSNDRPSCTVYSGLSLAYPGSGKQMVSPQRELSSTPVCSPSLRTPYVPIKSRVYDLAEWPCLVGDFESEFHFRILKEVFTAGDVIEPFCCLHHDMWVKHHN